MKVLSYAPSISAVVAVTRNGETLYKDLSDDVVQCTVSRKVDGASTFTVKLQNVNWKYNGFFMPMDRIAISCVKKDSHKLFAGYLTDVPQLTVYNGDVTISGSCPIYRLQQLYWDVGLVESAKLTGMLHGASTWDEVLVNLLTKVGGIPAEHIIIGDMPPRAMEVARELYAANLDSSEQLKSMVNDFYELLRTHGPVIASKDVATSVSPTDTSFDATSTGGGALFGNIDFDVTESAFVGEWGKRINNWYRTRWAGSPLEGHGETYARAAYRVKFDPRFLPAVSGVEQSGGLVESGLNGNYYGWAVFNSGIGEMATAANGIDNFIYYMLSDEAVFMGKPIYQNTWEELSEHWAWPNWQGWQSKVAGYMSEI